MIVEATSTYNAVKNKLNVLARSPRTKLVMVCVNNDCWQRVHDSHKPDTGEQISLNTEWVLRHPQTYRDTSESKSSLVALRNPPQATGYIIGRRYGYPLVMDIPPSLWILMLLLPYVPTHMQAVSARVREWAACVANLCTSGSVSCSTLFRSHPKHMQTSPVL